LKQKHLKDLSTANTAICIAGAHRSGTSMLTRLLHTCGLYLGPKKELMLPQADNPDGFWEHLGFVALNEELLNELGGAWDLPPKPDEDFRGRRLDALRKKARLLIAGFDSARLWGWKDPRNCLTLPFWHDLLPKLKILIIVRNPLEVAHSMRERNGTSYSFGLRLWEIYNRRLILAAAEQDRFVTHYDAFFNDAEAELGRIARFARLPEDNVKSAAALIKPGRRHTHFTIDQLIDARVSTEILALYRALMAEAGQGARGSARRHKGKKTGAAQTARTRELDLLPGSVSRLKAFVPEQTAEIQQLRERFAKTEARHKSEIEQVRQGYELELQRRKSEIEQVRQGYELELQRYKSEIEQVRQGYELELQRYKSEIEQVRRGYELELQRLKAEVEQVHEGYKAELKRMEAEQQRLRGELAQLRDRFLEISALLRSKSISLAEDERLVLALRERLRKDLWSVRKLSRLLDDAEKASARLRSSRRWKLANPLVTVKAALSRGKLSTGYGPLEKIVAAYSKWKVEHPEIAKIEDEIQALRRPIAPKEAEGGLETSAQKMDASPGPPAPALAVKSICFPKHREVEASIIIPVFNQFQHTHACVASLQTAEEPVPFEVIVVDDCSTDETMKFVPQMDGVVYLRNERNSGFINSCNRGADKARGKYLVFLNNDTLVTKGWLTTLLDTFAEEPKAGIVGSKLIYPDGRLQEAGGIIWRDASGWNYGKFDDAKKPEYNYLREVDYCSAAALMIQKGLFQSVGGFDLRYAPAYYEDTDLAFKVRKNGYKVLYQPLSEIVHYEGATGGTDLSTGTKKHQGINRLTFMENWATELAARPVNGDLTFLQQPPAGGKNILVIDHHLPMLDRDSGSLRMFQILKLLHQLGHRVTFIPDNLADIPPYTGELQKRGIEVVYHPYINRVRDYLISSGSEFDVVVLSRSDFARKHIGDVRLYAPRSRIIFDTVDLNFLREHREAQLTGDPETRRKALEKERLEHELIEQADETWVVSSLEQQLLQKEWPDASIQVVSNIVDIPGSSTPFALRRDWLFIGSFLHPPNIDAVLFFVEKIYPLVSERLRDAKFYIIGDNAPPEIVALATERIVIAGLQREVRQFFESVKLSVAPLRFGAGVKGKINQSMAFGVPVVATSLAVEGMELTDREDVLVANAPEDFARALIELYESEELWNRLSKNGIKKTKALYSIDAAREKLQAVFSYQHLKSLGSSDNQRHLAIGSMA
jgi:GT2 family glycosyltransferase/glycosyltransferase involved in cell wall biosynthesis